jgi:methanogenic corrinoid protein MtbC1
VPPPNGHVLPQWNEGFVATIEAEIVPRLLALTGHGAGERPAADDLVAAVADAAVAGESGLIEQHIAHHVLCGGSVADALMTIVAPAARRLGTDWEDDTRDFMDVTIGLGTLHRVLMSLTDLADEDALPNRRILLAGTPGEDHTLGLAIIDHAFRVARWDVQHEPYGDRGTLVGAVASDWFAVVGISLGTDGFADETARTIKDVRQASLNRFLRVLVGGTAFDRSPGLVHRVGADAVARDGKSAVAIANGWLASAGRFR